MGWTERVVAHLADEGHRLTGPRRAILDYILRYSVPFTSEELIADLQKAGVHVGRATVYRTLELLHNYQWLSLVHRPEGEHGYVVAEPGHQHHLVCRRCGMVTAFQGCEIESLLGGLAERLNFRIEGHWLEAFGVCRGCQRANNERV
ncbi:MAG: transcriptional repressor [Chloroflexota bacterium]|nr:transcriptional repressor [Chloroflexota bacterium]PLS77298.1 MAG: transcriptional repressor [Chloroflexota bacterium]